jgi:hypothetical protein
VLRGMKCWNYSTFVTNGKRLLMANGKWAPNLALYFNKGSIQQSEDNNGGNGVGRKDPVTLCSSSPNMQATRKRGSAQSRSVYLFFLLKLVFDSVDFYTGKETVCYISCN